MSLAENTWQPEFVAYLQAQDLQPRSVANYRAAIDTFADWFQATYSRPFGPRQLTGMDVRSYKHALQAERGLAARTVNVSLAALRMLAKFSIDQGYLGDNVAAGVAFVAIDPEPPRWLTRPEMRRLIAELERSLHDAQARGADQRTRQALRDKAIITLSAGAGLRVSEIVDTQLADIELSARSGKVTVRQGKGNRQRVVPLGPEPRLALQAWLEERGAKPGPLFTSQKGGAMSRRAVQRMYDRQARRAGLPQDRSFHSLRHYFAKRVVDDHGLEKAQRLLGHQRIQTTAIYAEPSRQELELAVEGIF